MPCSKIYYTSLAVLLAALLSGACAGAYEHGNVQPAAIKQSCAPLVRHCSTAASTKNMSIIYLAVARKALPVPVCTLQRDPGLQSHFMMLRLCWSEQRFNEQKWEQKRKREEQREDTTAPFRKTIWPVMAILQGDAPRKSCAASEAGTV